MIILSTYYKKLLLYLFDCNKLLCNQIAPFESLFYESHLVIVLLPHHSFVFVSKVELEHPVSSSTLKPATKII